LGKNGAVGQPSIVKHQLVVDAQGIQNGYASGQRQGIEQCD